MKKNQVVWGWVALAVVLVLVIAWSQGLFSRSEGASNMVRLGYIGPLTGDVAVLGDDALKAIELAVEQANQRGGVNGKMVKLYVEDDQYSTAQSISAYEKMVNTDGVETIIMSTYGGFTALAERAKQDKVLLVDSLDCDEDIAGLDDVFCVAKETKDLADVIADFAVAQGYRNIGILHGTNDNFMGSVASMFRERIGDKAAVQVESYVPGTVEFRTPLTKLRGNNALVFLGYDEIGIAIRQARELGLSQQMLTIPTVATTPSIQKAAGGAIDGIYFSFYAPLDSNEAADRFQRDFEAKHGRPPFVFVASDHAFDAAGILLNEVLPQVSARTKAGRFAQKVEAMHDVKDYDGVSGTLTMKEDGRIDGILIRLYQLENLVPVYKE